MNKPRSTVVAFVLASASILAGGPRAAEPAGPPETGWSDEAELSFVATAGNSETSTLGFKNVLKRQWERALLTVSAGGIRAKSTSTVHFATAPATDPSSITLSETDFDATTAENYFLKGRYDRNVTQRLFWFGGAGWDRNRFAGIDNRYVAEGGVGNIWFDREDLKFRTTYGLTFTKQEDVVQLPSTDENFLGARVGWDYLNRFGENTSYTNTLVLDENLDETSDWRADMINSLSVSMTERLALKLSLQLLYDNQPAFQTVPVVLLDPLGVPTGVTGITFVELDELDTVFTTSLVVSF